MACKGCRRNKSGSGSRRKSKTITKATTQNNSSIAPAELFNRKKKCSRCPFTTSLGVTGRCKKANRMISKAVLDPSFKCPIKRFEVVLSI